LGRFGKLASHTLDPFGDAEWEGKLSRNRPWAARQKRQKGRLDFSRLALRKKGEPLNEGGGDDIPEQMAP
jgi:hypothetical protein